jgi:hypothetical protein
VKPSARIPTLQLNLSFSGSPGAALPNDKQQELIVAIAEMLVAAAQEAVNHPPNGGSDESETDE